MASIVATWAFGIHSLQAGREMLMTGQSALHTCEESIALVESDAALGVYFVGRGGAPNSAGTLQCDAAIMTGNGHRFGAVAALERIPCPIRVARRVLEKSPPNFLVGQGAQDFAVREGFQLENNEDLVGKQFQKGGSSSEKSGHDTLGLIVRDKEGHLVVGVSTSGLANKHPGRVGDSPLPGGGLYVDAEVGAACATGDGDHILRFSASHQAVRLMEQGLDPQRAAQSVIKEIAKKVDGNMFEMGLITMDKQGGSGAAGSVQSYTDPCTYTTYDGFPYAVWSEEYHPEEKILTSPPVVTVHT